MNNAIQWSWISFLLYSFMGVICFWGCTAAKKSEIFTGKRRKVFSIQYWPMIAVWLFMAVFRLVNSVVGGKDAPSYIYYFERCLNISGFDSTDILFKWFNQIVRSFSSDYHVFFFIYYLIIITSMILFINEFSRLRSSSIPLLIAVFLFLRSFTSMRSNFAIAIIMISLVFLNKKKYILSVIFAVASIFIHVISFIYLLFYVFYWLYKKRNMNIWKSVLLIVLSYAASLFIRNLMISGAFGFLTDIGTGAYASYAGRSLGLSFAEIFNVSNIPQILLFVVTIVNRKKLDAVISNSNEADKRKITILRYVCYFDFFVVPVITLLGVYRGYEYFYLARLLLWGEMIPIILNLFNKKSQKAVKVIFSIVFLGWMANRLNATIETSNLMPYIFGGF